MMNERSLRVLLAAATSLLLGTSCGEDSEPSSGDEAPLGATLRDEPASVGAGGGIELEGVNASGAGCPTGTWRASSMPDGSGYAITFEDFGLSVNRASRSLQSVACNVTLRVKASKHLSYAVAAYEIAGEAQLGTGTTAEFMANLAFTGVGVAPTHAEYRKQLPTGPFTATVEPAALSWAPCDISSNIQVRARLTLDAKDPAADAKVRISSLGRLKLLTRACDGSALPPGASDAAVASDPRGMQPPPSTDGGTSAPPPSPDLPVVRVTTAGSACSGQRTKSVIAPDGRDLTVSFDDFVASNERSNAYCRVAIEVAAPEGKSYALAGFSGEGSAELAEGVSARLISLTDLTGAGVDLTREKITLVTGPRGGPIAFRESFVPQQLSFSPCGARSASLGLRFRVVLDAPSGKSGRFSLGRLGDFRFVQRDCP